MWSDSPYPLPSQRGTSGGGSVLLQELHDAGVTKVTRHKESSNASSSSQSGICPSCQKLTHHLQVTILARHVERSAFIFLDLIDASPSYQKLTHHLHVTLPARYEERSAAIYIG